MIFANFIASHRRSLLFLLALAVASGVAAGFGLPDGLFPNTPFPRVAISIDAGERPIDLACLGRLAVDYYAEQFGSSLEAARSMAVYLGGSSANLAYGVARLGGKSAMISWLRLVVYEL